MRHSAKTAAVLMVVLTLTTSAYAGKKTDAESVKVQKMAPSLVAGITSENDGLRRSSIYYAGKYKVTEAVEALCAQLNKEKNPRTRILIALSLYSIGSAEGLAAVKTHVNQDSDPKVRRMCAEIYETFLMNNEQELYTVTDR